MCTLASQQETHSVKTSNDIGVSDIFSNSTVGIITEHILTSTAQGVKTCAYLLHSEQYQSIPCHCGCFFAGPLNKGSKAS